MPIYRISSNFAGHPVGRRMTSKLSHKIGVTTSLIDVQINDQFQSSPLIDEGRCRQGVDLAGEFGVERSTSGRLVDPFSF